MYTRHSKRIGHGHAAQVLHIYVMTLLVDSTFDLYKMTLCMCKYKAKCIS